MRSAFGEARRRDVTLLVLLWTGRDDFTTPLTRWHRRMCERGWRFQPPTLAFCLPCSRPHISERL